MMLRDVHVGCECPTKDNAKVQLLRGSYEYYHYGCDGFKDQGWGCGYRTLQTLCSWLRINHFKENAPVVPSIHEVQAMLVKMEDKPSSFLNSREWIGSVEASYIISHIYDWDCRLIHANAGSTLNNLTSDLAAHLAKGGGPVMAGGDMDCSAKCIVGVAQEYLLVVDPHYVGNVTSKEKLQNDGWIRWYHVDEFLKSSFYNFCLPIPPALSS